MTRLYLHNNFRDKDRKLNLKLGAGLVDENYYEILMNNLKHVRELISLEKS